MAWLITPQMTKIPPWSPITTPPPPSLQRFLAFDWGQKRTGCASGNRLTETVNPITTLQGVDVQLWSLLQKLLKEWQPDALVVGLPFYPDGQPHKQTLAALGFAKRLQILAQCPTYGVDERYSTTEAHRSLSKHRLHQVDAESACVILLQFFSEIRLLIY